VTPKANGNNVDVFAVGPFGQLSAAPVVNPLPGAVPFAVALDQQGHLAVAEAGTNSVVTFALAADGAITQLASVATGQAATCWIIRVGDVYYAANAGSATLSDVQSADGGSSLTLLGQTPTDAGTVDAAASRDGRFVYAQTGAAGVVDEFAVNRDGSLTGLGSVTVPGAAGGEGIVAS
jgi:6-phosphogluconolactonase (cycloisomerase 2 family)